MDSFFENPRPKCCDPFPGLNLKFCWEVDSNYCTSCGRWLEDPRVDIPRMERHTKNCPNEHCVSVARFCKCGHSDFAHRKSLQLNCLQDKSQKEIEDIFDHMLNGPHNCDSCKCIEWDPDYDGPCD